MAFIFGVSKIVFINQYDPPINYEYTDGILMLIATSIIFMILALYLEQVLPNELGSNKSPLFFLNFLKRNKKTNDKSILLL